MRLLGLLPLIVASPAVADDVKNPPLPQLELEWRPVYEAIWRAGTQKIEGVDSDTFNVVGFAAGMHRDRLALLGEYSIGGVGYHVDVENARGDTIPETIGSNGLMHRFGVVAHYSVAKLISAQEKDGAQGFADLYLESGAGLEVIRWDDGGTLVRPDLAVGIGVSMGGRVSPTQRGAWQLGVRIHVARRSDRDGLSDTCSAPCTWPSAPTAWSDRTIMFESAFEFGR